MAERANISFFGSLWRKAYVTFLKLDMSYKLLILTIVATCILSLYLGQKYLENQFHEKAKGVSNSILVNIESMDEEMSKTLISASTLIQDKFLQNPNFSRQELIKLTNSLGITAVSLFNKSDGLAFMTTGRFLDSDYEHSKFYKETSVTNLAQCAEQMCGNAPCRVGYEVKNCQIIRSDFVKSLQMPGKHFAEPLTFMYNKPNKVLAKRLIVFNQQLNKIFDLLYFDEDIMTTIKKNVSAHNDFVKYISITDLEGNLMTEFGSREKGALSVKVPFNNSWDFNIEDRNISHNLLLNAEFSTKELNYQILILRVLIGLVAGLFILLLLVFGTKLEGQQDTITILHRLLKDKNKVSGKKTNPPYVN